MGGPPFEGDRHDSPPASHRRRRTVRRTQDEPTVIAPAGAEASLVPVRRDGRIVGAYVLSAGTVRYRPVVDLEQVLSAVAGVAAVVGGRGSVRRRPAQAAGGRRRDDGSRGLGELQGRHRAAVAAGRPWWARALLRARRLVVEHKTGVDRAALRGWPNQTHERWTRWTPLSRRTRR